MLVNNVPTKFIMLIGIAGAGKTTVANKLSSQMKTDGENVVILSSDSIRKEIYGDESCQKNPTEVFRIMNERTMNYLKKQISVIYDATNLCASRRRAFITNIKHQVNNPIYFQAIEVHCNPAEAIKRQNTRERKVPEDVILKQAKQLEPPTYEEGWDNITINV